MNGTMTISLSGLQFHAFHGWHDEEAKTGNTFEVDALLTISSSEMIEKLDQTVNYVRAYEIIWEEMEHRQQLLETLAMKIANRLKEAFPELQRAVISIKKLTAPIPNFSGSVGVSYTKDF